MFASSWVNLLQMEILCLDFLLAYRLIPFHRPPSHQETRSNPEVLPDAFVAKDFVVDTEVIQEVLKR